MQIYNQSFSNVSIEDAWFEYIYIIFKWLDDNYLRN